jgi:hypothetical protein
LDNLAAQCPGCAATFAPHSGAVHPYIGASAGCWALYCAVLARSEQSAELLTTSTVLPVHAADTAAHPGADVLLLDAYAAQHHGVPSPQAIQSVAVHLLVLHGVFARAMEPEGALWIRRQAVRRKGVYAWLPPPPPKAAYALRHCFPATGGHRVRSIATYVRSVYEAWRAPHQQQLDAWYDAFIAT